MIAASVGKKQIGKTLLIIVVVIVIIVGAIYFIGKGKDGEEIGGAIKGATAEEREAYLLSLGIQVDPTSSIADVGVPAEWDERFTAYNETLKATGFDLEGLKGETVKKCTYTVTNREDISASVTAVLLIYNDEIVAGHLVDNINNKILPLFEISDESTSENATEEDPEAAEETILPSETAGTDIEDEQKPEGGETTEDEVETGAYPTE